MNTQRSTTSPNAPVDSSLPLLDAKKLAELTSVLGAMQREADQKRRLTPVVGNFRLSCDNVIDLIDLCKSWQPEAIILLYPAIADREHFDQVLARLKFQEDRDDVNQALGL